jgi:hypothetical protein
MLPAKFYFLPECEVHGPTSLHQPSRWCFILFPFVVQQITGGSCADEQLYIEKLAAGVLSI